MPRRLALALALATLTAAGLPATGLPATAARAQTPERPGDAGPGLPADALASARPRSAGAAFGLSLAVPGLGHRYATGTWGTAATTHALADAALWVALLDAGARSGRAVDAYEALAATRADVQDAGQGRGFYLNVGRYPSSDAYVEALLRERRWEELEAAQRPENAWRWASETDRARFQAIREDAEALRRRRPVYGALLAANRVLAGVGAIRAARGANRAAAQLSLGPPPAGGDAPTLHLSVRF